MPTSRPVPSERAQLLPPASGWINPAPVISFISFFSPSCKPLTVAFIASRDDSRWCRSSTPTRYAACDWSMCSADMRINGAFRRWMCQCLLSAWISSLRPTGETLGRPCSACMCEDCTCRRCIYKFSVPASVQRTHTLAASSPLFFSAWMRHYSIFQHKVYLFAFFSSLYANVCFVTFPLSTFAFKRRESKGNHDCVKFITLS